MTYDNEVNLFALWDQRHTYKNSETRKGRKKLISILTRVISPFSNNSLIC